MICERGVKQGGLIDCLLSKERTHLAFQQHQTSIKHKQRHGMFVHYAFSQHNPFLFNRLLE